MILCRRFFRDSFPDPVQIRPIPFLDRRGDDFANLIRMIRFDELGDVVNSGRASLDHHLVKIRN